MALLIILFALVLAFIAIALPFKLLFNENSKARIASAIIISIYIFTLIILFIINNKTGTAFQFASAFPILIIAVIGLIFCASYVGVISLIFAILVSYYSYRVFSNKTEAKAKCVFISAFIFHIALFIFINIFVPLQIRLMAFYQFGKNQCGIYISSPLKMLELSQVPFETENHATILTPNGEYNWSFAAASWTPNTYTGASSDDVKALEKKKLKDIESYKLCVSKRR